MIKIENLQAIWFDEDRISFEGKDKILSFKVKDWNKVNDKIIITQPNKKTVEVEYKWMY